jgi:uncharacterized protein (DUF2236 family)
MSAVDRTSGETFRIDADDLLRWVYVTATESFCHTAQRAGLGLTDEEVDRYYAEQLVVARLVGLDPDTVPATADQIEDYYERMRPRLAADADAKATARFLAVPTFPWGLGWTPVRPIWIGVAGYGFSLLPPWARRLYGLPGLFTTDLTVSLTARALRMAIRSLPMKALEGPVYRAAMARAARARAASTTLNAGDSARIASTRTAGTRNATR